MKRTLKDLFFGKSPILSALIALLVVGSIVLGCTCNDKDGFAWDLSNSSSDSSSDDTDGKTDEKPAKKADASKGEIPEEAEMEEIVKATLLDFDKALKNEDFSNFYDNISEPWQKETSPRQLKRLFQKFIDGGADLSSIRGMDADFTKRPAVREQLGYEMLEVEGRFDTSPRPTTFELKYIAEGEDWKLSAISVVTGLKR